MTTFARHRLLPEWILAALLFPEDNKDTKARIKQNKEVAGEETGAKNRLPERVLKVE